MKNLLFLISAVAIIASSCSSKIGISKRKYGKGYYVSVSHKPKSVNNTQNIKQSVKLIPEAVAQVRVNKSEEIPVITEKQAFNQLPIKTNQKNIKNSDKTTQASATKISHIQNNTLVSTLSTASLNKLNSSNKAEDTNTILLVILCLFWWLNLIAVYLHQGKKITTDFWITLILDLTIILGVVYSILVVLDVLSFA